MWLTNARLNRSIFLELRARPALVDALRSIARHNVRRGAGSPAVFSFAGGMGGVGFRMWQVCILSNRAGALLGRALGINRLQIVNLHDQLLELVDVMSDRVQAASPEVRG